MAVVGLHGRADPGMAFAAATVDVPFTTLRRSTQRYDEGKIEDQSPRRQVPGLFSPSSRRGGPLVVNPATELAHQLHDLLVTALLGELQDIRAEHG